jgi:hypothetical protein
MDNAGAGSGWLWFEELSGGEPNRDFESLDFSPRPGRARLAFAEAHSSLCWTFLFLEPSGHAHFGCIAIGSD